MQLSEQRIAQHDAWWSNKLNQKRLSRRAAARLLSQRLVDSGGEEDGGENVSSLLSRVSSSRYEGLEGEWWKAQGDSKVIKGGGSKATVQKGKQVQSK
jgi:hypothetical protein